METGQALSPGQNLDQPCPCVYRFTEEPCAIRWVQPQKRVSAAARLRQLYFKKLVVVRPKLLLPRPRHSQLSIHTPLFRKQHQTSQFLQQSKVPSQQGFSSRTHRSTSQARGAGRRLAQFSASDALLVPVRTRALGLSMQCL